MKVGGLFFCGLLASSAAQWAEASDLSGKVYTNGQWEQANDSISLQNRNQWLPEWFPTHDSNHPLSAAVEFLKGNANLLQTNASTMWIESNTHASEEFQTVRLRKEWNGIPVVGGDAVVHLNLGKVDFANADSTPLFGVSIRPSISTEVAEATAYSSYPGSAVQTENTKLVVLILENGQEKSARLAYRVVVRDRNHFSSDIHFIDADTAQEVMATSNVHTVAKRNISAGLGSELDFSLPFSDWKTVFSDSGCGTAAELGAARERAAAAISTGTTPAPCNEVSAKALASATSAWNNSGIVHAYYSSKHNRDSIDGKGMSLNSVVNFGGEGFPNAAWYNDKSLMLYGMGSEEVFNDFALPLDVAAHEITHGITSNTSNLEYVSESGALNESYSDVFGKLVAFSAGKATDWKLGKELFKDGSRFIRDMENPDVAHYDNFRYKGVVCSRLNDFCGVHSNSGIPNKAAVLLAKRIGLEKLGKLYYFTLTQLLKSNSNFKEAKDQTIAACQKLWGAKSLDCLAVQESFAAVGI